MFWLQRGGQANQRDRRERVAHHIVPAPSVNLTASHELNLTWTFALSTSVVLTGCPGARPARACEDAGHGCSCSWFAFLPGIQSGQANPAAARCRLISVIGLLNRVGCADR
jgi:hypothetical protein